MSSENQSTVEHMMADLGMDVDMFLHTAPPGEEAFDPSHAGGEHEAFEGLAHQLADLTGQYVFKAMCYLFQSNTHCSHHNDIRIWGEQIETQTTHWLTHLSLSFAGRRHSHLQPLLSHQYLNETLICYGYIGCTPMYPSVAISLHTLAAYCQAHRTCPWFTIQSQCKTFMLPS